MTLLTFDCPRCRRPVETEFYGPCDPCRTELRMTLRLDPVGAEAKDYEPKVNVTPNAVAMKDD